MFNKLDVDVYEDTKTGFLVIKDHKKVVRVYINPDNLAADEDGKRTPFLQLPQNYRISIDVLNAKVDFMNEVGT